MYYLIFSEKKKIVRDGLIATAQLMLGLLREMAMSKVSLPISSIHQDSNFEKYEKVIFLVPTDLCY